MVTKRKAVESAVKLAIDAVCKSGGGHPACPVVSGLLDLYLSSELDIPKTPAGLSPAGDRARRAGAPFAQRDKISLLIPEREKVPVSVRRGIRPEERRDPIMQLVQEQLQGSTTWTDLQAFFKQFGVPGPDTLVPLIASKFILRGLQKHVSPGVPLGAGGRIIESIATRLTPRQGVKRKLTGRGRTYYAPPGEAGF